MISILQYVISVGLLTIVLGSPCDHSPCHHQGTCHLANTTSGFTCSCIHGYVGVTCDVYTFCHPNPCGQHGTCSLRNTYPYYTCRCLHGYHGNECQYIDSCASNPCPPMNVCHRLYNTHSCRCYTGHDCSTTLAPDVCSSHTCHNGGTCITQQSGTTFQCRCHTGFSGDTCQVNNYCTIHNPCQSRGTCHELSHSPYYTCTCHTGYYGPTCHSLDHCLSSQCPPGYQCHHATYNSLGYICSCPRPPCAGVCDPNPCQNNGHCVAMDTSPFYECTCQAGFSGIKCEKDLCQPNPCQHGVCHRYHQRYQCRCNTGYHGYTCSTPSCPPGTCKNGGTCTPHTTHPYYHCTCPTGLKGTRCESTDHCLENPCPNGLNCVITANDSPGYQCECLHCTGSRCLPNPCANGGQCSVVSETPFYKCNCPTGYFGSQCRVDVCEPNPCRHGRCNRRGVTPLTHGSFACYCESGYHGFRCESESCPAGRCKNGGTCIPSSRQPYYHCNCPNGFIGTSCEKTDHCTTSPCPEGSTCVHMTHLAAGYECQFSHSTSNHCSPNPCGNGGRCSALVQSPYYKCTCLAGYHGPQCRVDVCEPNPCIHGHCNRRGVTSLSLASFTCTCIRGYHNSRCQTPSCTSMSCYHGGTCIPTNHSPYFKCTCPYGFTGEQCKTVMPTTSSTTTTTTTPRPTPKPTTVRTTHAPRLGPYCLTCNDVISPDTCEFVSLCGIHELCYIDEYVTSIGSIRYNLGCRDSNQCQGIKRDLLVTPSVLVADNLEEEDSTHILACSECCNHHICNSGGCGNVGFQSQELGQRGPVCFHCDQQTTPQSCEKITICGRDQFCSVQIHHVGTSNRTVWTSGCQTKSACLHGQTTNSDRAEAGLPTKRRYITSYQTDGTCKTSCCHADLCNRVCRDTTHTG